MTAPTQASLLPKELAEGRGAPLRKPGGAARRDTSFLFPPPSQGWGCPSLHWLLLSGPAAVKPESAPRDAVRVGEPDRGRGEAWE